MYNVGCCCIRRDSDVVGDLASSSLGYRPKCTTKHGGRDEIALTMVGRGGHVASKIARVGDCAGRVSDGAGRKSELAYALARCVREAARDIAQTEGIDWKANEASARFTGWRS